MEGRSIEQMIAVSTAVKGGMDNYIAKLEAKTRDNFGVFEEMRKSGVKAVVEGSSKGSANVIIVKK